MTNQILYALWQTIYMVIVSGLIAVIIGTPLGVLLKIWRRGEIAPHPVAHKVLAVIINAMRSIPFIILMLAIIPFTRFVAGTSIGTTAAIVPLSVSAFPFVARVIENALDEVPFGLIEASQAMGATTWQIVWKVLLPEAMPGSIRGITLMLVALVGYSAMAGTVGGGGLGDVAIRYGYERFEVGVMVITVVILIVVVQLLQWIGDSLARRCLKK